MTTTTFTDEALSEIARDLVRPFTSGLERHQNSTAYVSSLATLMFFAGRWAGEHGMSDKDAFRLLTAVNEARPA